MAGNHTATTDRLGTMKVPTLVINGELDHSLPARKDDGEPHARRGAQGACPAPAMPAASKTRPASTPW